jgi:hypothetical protein
MTRQRLRLVRSQPRPRPLSEVERHVLRVLPRLTEQGLQEVLATLRYAERTPAARGANDGR